MKKNSIFILLLTFCIIGCVNRTNKSNQQEPAPVTVKDTAFVISPFLRDGITYIDGIYGTTLIDNNYYPPQKYDLKNVKVTIKGNKTIVETDCKITHTIQSATYWQIIKYGSTISKVKLAILKTDKGEVRIAEIDGIMDDSCAIGVKYGNYTVMSLESMLYCKLPSEKIPFDPNI